MMAEEQRFPIDRSAILAFAGALGETNRIYWDEEYARRTPLGGVIAPPTFAAASSHWNPYHVFRGARRIPAPTPEQEAARRRRAEEARARGGAPPDIARVLHGEMRFEYHQPLRPGMTLNLEEKRGRTWEKEGRRGGLMRFSESVTEYRDEQGELVVTATSVGIVTEKAVE